MKVFRLLACLCLFSFSVQAEDDLELVHCSVENSPSRAECAAVCPAGMQVLTCGHSVGSWNEGDTCTSIYRLHAGPVNSEYQSSSLPFDRCSVWANCTDSSATLSASARAVCYTP